MSDAPLPDVRPSAGVPHDHAVATLAIAVAVAAPVLLAGCAAGGGGDSGDSSPTLSLTSIEVRTERDTADAVTINNLAQPASGPTGVAFALNGSPGQAADPGRSAPAHSWNFLAHVAGGSTDFDITVTINPSPATVAGVPLVGNQATFAEARHVASRTGFGGSIDDVMAMVGVDYDTVIDTLVDHLLTVPLQSAPDWINTTILTWSEFSALSQSAQNAYNDAKWPRREALKEWWLREIVTTSSPMTERLVAFWGNHFVVNIDDIEEPQIAWSWLTLLRTHASGNLRDFVQAMALHPAMLLYLDNASNVKMRPPGVTTGPLTSPSNENFGRELLELFTIGEGHGYNDYDVIQMARAFTGHNLDDRKAYLFNPTKHDDSTDITILGSTGAFTGPQALDRIFSFVETGDSVPRIARLIVEKLWSEFIGSDPTASGNVGTVTTLAQHFAVDFELKPLYKEFFKRAEFRAGATDASLKLLKTPLEHIAGFYRSLRLTPRDGHWDWRVYEAGSEDQDPLAPPNVKGWLGGTSWINAKTLLERFGHDTNYGWDLNSLTDANLPTTLMDGYESFFLAVPRIFAAPTLHSWEQPFATLMRALLRDPAYQMK